MISAIPAIPSPRPAARGIKDLLARMGHDSERAAPVYQHEARGADKMITDTLDAHVQAKRGGQDDDDGPAAALVPVG